MMVQVMHALAVVILLLSGFYLWRIVYGPSVFDRVVALNAIGTKIPVMIVLLGMVYDRVEMFEDIVVALLLLNLFTTLLIGRYIRERRGKST